MAEVLQSHIAQGIAPLTPESPADQMVPDALRDALFGPGAKTFVLLDAAKITNLYEMLELSELPFVCLFKDDAAEDMRDAAPYLVELYADHPLTRQLFVDDPDTPWHLWSCGPGVFVRATCGLDALRAHFRKFTMLRDSGTGRWNMFRFSAPEIFRTMVMSSPQAQAALMGEGIVSMACPGLDQTWVTLTRTAPLPDGPRRVQTLDARMFHDAQVSQPYIAERRELRLREGMTYLQTEAPGQVASLSEDALRAVVTGVFDRCAKTGITDPSERLKHLLIAAAWGCHFEVDPARAADLKAAGWMSPAGEATGFRAASPLILRTQRWMAQTAQDTARPQRLITGLQQVYADPRIATDRASLAALVTRLWPARAAYLGAAGVRALVDGAQAVAARLNLRGQDAAGYAALAPYFGTYFAYDPLYPWATAALADDGRDAETRRQALGAGIITYWTGLQTGVAA